MANSESIKKYLIEGEKPYLANDANNGTILMLSGVWGSGKTHFWKNIIEKDLIPKIKEKEKSYIFVSLYGKDSIEELQNEILQKSYSFVHHQNTDVISQTYSVFTKITSLMPKITAFGVGIDATNTAKQIEELNNNEKLKKGTEALLNGGIICFDDFERKSSKIDLNDLFGFITNLTENFQTKTIIILNQEFFQDHDTKVFNTVKEKSVNKFILYDPSIEELFEVIYQDEKYKPLESYKTTILEAIKLSEEKNARIYIQVLNNCLEYIMNNFPYNKLLFFSVEQETNESLCNTRKLESISRLTLVTILFIKYNIIFKPSMAFSSHIIKYMSYESFKTYQSIHETVFRCLVEISRQNDYSKENFLTKLKEIVENMYKNDYKKKSNTESLKGDFLNISNNENTLFLIYKYIFKNECFAQISPLFLEKLNNFVESGILLEE